MLERVGRSISQYIHKLANKDNLCDNRGQYNKSTGNYKNTLPLENWHCNISGLRVVKV